MCTAALSAAESIHPRHDNHGQGRSEVDQSRLRGWCDRLSLEAGAVHDPETAHPVHASRRTRPTRPPERARFCVGGRRALRCLVLILDPTGRIVRVNASYERASGYSLSAIKDKRVWEILSSSEERDGEHAAFERLNTERGTNSYEGSLTARDGSRHEIAWSNSVLLDSDGGIDHVVCTGVDVTARNQAEERARFLARMTHSRHCRTGDSSQSGPNRPSPPPPPGSSSPCSSSISTASRM